MTYDEAIENLGLIIEGLESDEAISMEQYKQKALEAKKLIAFCKEQLVKLESELKSAVKD